MRRSTGCTELVHTEPLIHYYEEEAQERRTGPEHLHPPELRRHWSFPIPICCSASQSRNGRKVDARAEIHKLVDELNDIGVGFNLSEDFVLKAGPHAR